MKLVSMKITPQERKEKEEAAVPNKIEQPSYPYGLELRLSKPELEKLGLSAALQVGDECVVSAKAKVTSVEMRQHEGGDHEHVTLQLTDLGVEAKPPPEKMNMGQYAEHRNEQMKARGY